MLVLFCLRLACGLIGALLLLCPSQVNPRFYRVQFLTAEGLTAVALVLSLSTANPLLTLTLIAAILACTLGSISSSLNDAPGLQTLIALSTVVLVGAVALAEWSASASSEPVAGAPVGYGGRLLADLTSAALLGTATTAMLMGHSYLIAPAMSLTPLLRLLGGLLGAVLLRMIVAAAGLWSWTESHSLSNLADETVWFLPVRWGVGFVGPLVLAWMAWQSARIRSTQSATGILYVVVIFCFLGELVSQLLGSDTGYLL
jgi:hypothetical protein